MRPRFRDDEELLDRALRESLRESKAGRMEGEPKAGRRVEGDEGMKRIRRRDGRAEFLDWS